MQYIKEYQVTWEERNDYSEWFGISMQEIDELYTAWYDQITDSNEDWANEAESTFLAHLEAMFENTKKPLV